MRRATSAEWSGMSDDHIADDLRRLEGKTFYTLIRHKPFDVVDVLQKHVRIMPREGKRKLRSILLERIATVANMRLSRDELLQQTKHAFPDSRNTSYIAALVHEISKSTQ
jgi:hypothetical protein